MKIQDRGRLVSFGKERRGDFPGWHSAKEFVTAHLSVCNEATRARQCSHLLRIPVCFRFQRE